MEFNELIRWKLDAMHSGNDVITNNRELDAMNELKPTAEIRSLPNPGRVGLLDQYVAWTGEEREIMPE